jgi:hypothetical protein
MILLNTRSCVECKRKAKKEEEEEENVALFKR